MLYILIGLSILILLITLSYYLIGKISESLKTNLYEMRRDLFESLKMNQDKIDSLKSNLFSNISQIQKENNDQANRMRDLISGSLPDSIDKRIVSSFSLVSDKLNSVHQGLGEMQKLATNVEAFQKIFSNSKAKGIWGEIQLEAILSDILTKQQYERDLRLDPNSNQKVEFAIKIPNDDPSTPFIWLPIDSKFPLENYRKLTELRSEINSSNTDEMIKKKVEELRGDIKKEAKKISEKYIVQGYTTNFAIMFLPVENMYLEILSTGLVEDMQKEHRVIIAGPANISAMINALQIGLKTVALGQQSRDIISLFEEVQKDFIKIVEILDKAKKEMSNSIKNLDEISKKAENFNNKFMEIQNIDSTDSGIKND